MTTLVFGKELFIRFTASAFRKLPSIYILSYFPFGFEGRMSDLIVSVPDHCLSFYFEHRLTVSENDFEYYLTMFLNTNELKNELCRLKQCSTINFLQLPILFIKPKEHKKEFLEALF